MVAKVVGTAGLTHDVVLESEIGKLMLTVNANGAELAPGGYTRCELSAEAWLAIGMAVEEFYKGRAKC